MVINKSEQQFHHNVAMTNFGFIPVTNYVHTNEAIFSEQFENEAGTAKFWHRSFLVALLRESDSDCSCLN